MSDDINNSLQDFAWLARVRKTQGRKGEVFCDLLTDFPEKFAERRELFLLNEKKAAGGATAAPRAVALTNHWPHKGGMVLHFAGVDSISAAEELIGLVVAIPAEARAALGPDEAYISDLVGCALYDIAGGEPAMLGPIRDVDRASSSVPLLVVDHDGGELLVPFAKAYLRRIDLAAKRVEMELPLGLIEINAAETK